MKKSKEDLYKQESEKSKNKYRTSFYYVDIDKAERLGVTEYKATVGDKFVRIISPDIDKFWALEIFKHSNIGTNRATFLCLDKMFGKPCPICERIKEIREKDPKDPKIAALRYSRRYLVFLYDVENRDAEGKGLRWYDMPVNVKDNIMSLCVDKRTGKFTEIEHPDDGKDIEFRRVGTTQETTKYSGFKLVDNDPIPSDWLEDVPQFVDVLRIPTYEGMAEELTGMVSESKDEKGSEKKAEEEHKDDQREEKEERQSGRRRQRREEREETEAEVETEAETEVVEEDSSQRRGRGRNRNRDRDEDDSSEVVDNKEDEKESRRERARRKADELKERLASRRKG
ncbi:MAG: hypothetical protein ACTSUP_03330 [Candidatus Heimdallarchaeaceae archaeon]